MLRFKLALAALISLVCHGAMAQDVWPSRPIKVIVPVAAGGTVDIVARMLAQEMSKGLGQSVVVENRPSSASLVGTQLVAKAAPDGYTLLAHSSTFFTAPLIAANAGYDPVRDFTPITLTCKAPMVVVTGPGLQVKNLSELVQQAKANPGSVSVASSGNGSTGHIASEVFANRAGLRMLNVFYKGNAQAVVDVVSGQTQLLFDQFSTSIPHVRSGKLRPLAVTSLSRSPLFPDVPTIAESGYPGYEDVTWNLLLAPAGTPKEIVNRLHAEIVKAYAQPELIAKFAERGIELTASTSSEVFGQQVRAEVGRLSKLSKDAGIKAE
jgi:tripartite-type tricarboxylate transporter receptor subunit TctC